MAQAQQLLDVWIVESNTVYQKVPFSVVTDWVQQGRLLENDQAKAPGTKEWRPLGSLAEFGPYFPKPEPHRPQDPAEALEPVGLDIHVKKAAAEEDTEVDMIPLIDVSLVLLVFFMLTASGAAISSTVNTPVTEFGLMSDNPNALRIDITQDRETGQVLYSLGSGQAPAPDDDRDLHTVGDLLERLKGRLAAATSPELVINADKDLPARVARDLLVALRAEPFRSKLKQNFFGVSEKEP